MNSSRVILRPVFTEKTSLLEAAGKYTFLVATDANKVAVAQAVSDIYGVKPVNVRMINVDGKKVRFGRHLGKRRNEKKAIVTLKAGDKITVMEGV